MIGEAEEKRILDEFRKKVKDLGQTDTTLRRFLRARNHDIIKAEDMLRKSIEWRKLNDVDNALSWKIDARIEQEFPIEHCGVDFNNRAVVFIPAGAWHVRDMIENGFKEDMLKNIYIVLERIVEHIERTGEQFTLIVDLQDLSYWKLAHYETIQMTLKTFRDFEANYPERLGEAFIINAPLVLNYIWPLIKPLLTGNTLQKLKFLGSSCSKYLPEILQRIPSSSLPEALLKDAKLHNVKPEIIRN